MPPPRPSICLVLAALHLFLISGCSTREQLTYLPTEVSSSLNTKILSITLKSGRLIWFDKKGGTYVESERDGRLYRSVVGVTPDGRAVDVDLEEASEVVLERMAANTAGTIIMIALGVPTVMIAAMMVKLTIDPPRSCPYVYSYDGERYVFDGQSYAGAISRALKRQDFTRLDSLRAVDGRYHLMLRNDPPNETQYTDEVKLLVVDHPRQTHVAFGYDGTSYAMNTPAPPLAAYDANGRDVLRWLARTDRIVWQSELPTDTSYRHQPLREQLLLAFPRPADPRTALLVVHGGSGYWGSMMIERFISLRGNRLYDWYRELERGGPAFQDLRRMGEGEELYHLRVEVLGTNGWTVRGMIHSGSSLADEERVIPLDLRDVPGDTVWMKLRPPRGFWKFDGISLAANRLPAPQVIELAPVEARDDRGTPSFDLLKATDERYYVQDRPMEALRLWFDVPQASPLTERSLFLKTSGFYLTHTDTGRAEQTALLARLLQTDSSAIRFALDECYSYVAASPHATRGSR